MKLLVETIKISVSDQEIGNNSTLGAYLSGSRILWYV